MQKSSACCADKVEMEEQWEFVARLAEASAIPAIMQFVKVPSLSPMFDAEWQQKGLIEEAMNGMLQWALQQGVEGLTYEILRAEKAPPLLCIEVAGTAPTLVFYGHLDKQPPCTGWSDFCSAYSPVVRDGYLYGRGACDDGYALTSIVLALKTCQHFRRPHPRCVIVLENEEESGSEHLLTYLQRLQPRIGDPAAVIGLDTSVGDYHHLWMVESLRGMLKFDLTARVLQSAMHSGTAGGVVPSAVSVLFALLERIEDAETGRIRLPELYCDIPPEQYQRSLGALIVTEARQAAYDTVPSLRAASDDLSQLTLNRTQRPALCVIGADGAPDPLHASSVMLSSVTLTCSIRLPPRVDSALALAAVKAAVLTSPPHNAEVSVSRVSAATGWTMAAGGKAVLDACDAASVEVFGEGARRTGGGGSIPFVGMLQQLFPQTTVVLLGASGPDSHPHGPNERLNLTFYKQFACCLTSLLTRLASI